MRKDALVTTGEFQDSGLFGLEIHNCLGSQTFSFTSVNELNAGLRQNKADHAKWHKENDELNTRRSYPTASECSYDVLQKARIFEKAGLSGGREIEWRPL
jgi:hypothetical protein